MWSVLGPVLEHGLSSGFSGWLAYSLTWTMCRSWWRTASRSPQTISCITQADRYTRRLAWSAGFGASIASHLVIDYVVGHGWLG